MENTAKGIDTGKLKRQLQNEVEQWVNRTFNFINLNVVEKMARVDNTELAELIEENYRDTDQNAIDFIDNEGLKSKYKTWTSLAEAEGNESNPLAFVNELHDSDFDDWQDKQQDDNYPMWSTLFEFRTSNNDYYLPAAKKAGLGIINAFGDFNELLFMKSCGHSFYSAYWIPMYLYWNERAKEEYKDIDYSDL